jgi:UDP-2,3-diacylglucosamine hydrolase
MGKIFFASDFHLGIDTETSTSTEREAMLVEWLKSIEKDDTEAVYLLGDLFDFWFEYKHAVPKGFVRLLGQLAGMRDRGIPVFVFTGNHDMWLFDYFVKELDIEIIREPRQLELQGKRIFVGHGDGLGPGDFGYKLIKRIFANHVCQWLFARIHPNTGIAIAKFWSSRSRYANLQTDRYVSKEQEWLFGFAEETLKQTFFDYFIFGHRHMAIDFQLSNKKSRYINTGEWMYQRSYAVLENGEINIEFYKNEQGSIITD